MNKTQTRPGRGGPRPNSGRPAVLGDNQRKSVRLPLDAIRLATRAGRGNFSDGVRVLIAVADNVLMQPGNKPPIDDKIVYVVYHDGASGFAWFDHAGAQWLDEPGENPVAVRHWCNLPMQPGEVEKLLTSE